MKVPHAHPDQTVTFLPFILLLLVLLQPACPSRHFIASFSFLSASCIWSALHSTKLWHGIRRRRLQASISTRHFRRANDNERRTNSTRGDSGRATTENDRKGQDRVDASGARQWLKFFFVYSIFNKWPTTAAMTARTRRSPPWPWAFRSGSAS